MPMLHLMVQLGGDLRGGANGPLWHRMRAHPWYADDADLTIPEYARVTFAVRDAGVRAAIAALVADVPMVGVDPEQKQRDAVARELKKGDAQYPARVPPNAVRGLMASFVVACQNARTEP
jgi:hypothetical protein